MDRIQDAVIVGAARTPVGRFFGGLAGFAAPELGGFAIREAIRRSGVKPEEIDEVIMGNVLSGGVGQAPARQAAIAGGVPPEAGALTVNKVCGSGLKAVMLATQAIRLGDAKVVVAGGMESMSRAPFYSYDMRGGRKMGDVTLVDGMIRDGLWCPFKNWHMGSAAELTSDRSKITREEQDQFAYQSQMKAVAAIKEGRFKDEIVPVEVPQGKGKPPVTCDTDEGPRADTTLEGLAKLKPAFKADGTVTAGNAPSVNDGGAAVVVMSAAEASKRGMKPLARVVAYATAGTAPELLFYAPVAAVRRLMEQMNVGIGHFDLIEANEAFSVQALADGRELGWDWNRVNVNGGAVALGHPIGASGARILTTLLYAMKNRGAKTGLATLCLGGGNAVAMAVEAVS
jgi:acetyl-CoA C-acetyltransferase